MSGNKKEWLRRLLGVVMPREQVTHLFLREHLFVTLCKKAPVTMGAIVILATVVLFLFLPFVNPYVIGAWYLCVAVLSLIRLLKATKGCPDAQKSLDERYGAFRKEALLMAILWGFAAFAFFPEGETVYEMLLIFFILMLASASTVNLAIDRPVAAIYVYFLLVPLSLRLLLTGGTLYIGLSAAILLYGALLIMSIRQIGAVLQKGVRQHGELGALQNRMQMILEQTPAGIFYYDRTLKIVECNRVFTEILGVSKERLIGFDLHGMKDKKLLEMIKQVWKERRTLKFDGLYTSILSGKKIWISATIAPLIESDGRMVGAIGAVEDKTLEHEALEKAEFLAYHDSLTSLPNRKLLGDRFDSQIAQAGRKKFYSSLLFLDLDRFKHINDTYGHNIGDELLKESARRLLKVLRKSDTVCRLGGDEFIIFLPMISEDLTQSVQHTLSVSQKIHNTLAESFEIEKHKLFISTSIGAVMIGTRGESLDEVLRCADIAMYHAKKLGRGVTSFYEEFMDEQIKNSIRMEKELRHAIDKDELKLYFQPILDIGTNEIMGAEALLRWEHPSGMTLLPSEFIPVAEESQLIHQIGRWVIEEVCRTFNRWETQKERTPPYISVNLSPKQLRYNGFFERTAEIVQKSGVNPSALKFEITESVLIEDSDRAKELIDRFKQIGIGFMIDDFGTGYSSLSYLKRFDFETIKIDKSFIRDILRDEDDMALIKAILDIARQFSYSVIAEGIESREQKEKLQTLDPDILYQGYLYSGPLCEADFLTLMRKS
ncbi:putative bifunctional diguanylate cyclase/phosphodiesterase [Hydrogenimonas sp.]